jgi:hypothetical protein
MARKGIVLGVTGFIVLAVSLALSVPHRVLGELPQQGQNPDDGFRPGEAGRARAVVVVNTPNDPIPVAAQGVTQVVGTVEVTNNHCTCGKPFSVQLSSPGDLVTKDSFTVPAHKLLVLEFCTLLDVLPGGGGPGEVAMLEVLNPKTGTTVVHYMTITFQTGGTVLSFHTGTHAIKVYAAAGETVRVRPLGSSTLTASLSGRLEDAP